MHISRLKKFAALALAHVMVGVAGSGCGGGSAETPLDRVRESGFRGITLEVPTPKVDFTLTDTEGRPFHFLAETEGYITLLFFGYTYCPDICPVHLANLAAVLKEMPWDVRSRIRLVFVSTDPDRDTPERIREWLDAFDRSFIGLRGEIDEVNRIQASFGLPPAQVQGGDSTNYIIGHASQILAFGTDNLARLAYPFGTRQADWSHDLPRLVRQGPVLRIDNAVVAAPIAGGEVTALYLEIANEGSIDDELLAVATTVARKTELHRQVDHGGTTTMEEVEALPVPAGGSLAMHPGGYHVMVLGLDSPLKPGESVQLELHFRKSGVMRHLANVVDYAEIEGALDHHHDHHSGGGH